ncbi:MAG: alpha/beta hydrolase-fold protein, partial [Actinomycetota bacterium]
LDRELPEAVVVAMEHLTDDFRALVQHRAADFTPTRATAPPETGVRIGADEVGGAAAFRRVLIDHILTEVAERWRVTDDRTLVGHSFSALFGVDTLLCEPAAFHRWVLASPSVWWDNRVMFDREAEHARTHDDIKARVFMSKGTEEGGGELFGGHEAFYRQLSARDHANLDLHWQVFEGETHQSVIAPAVARGLRTVFAPTTGEVGRS